MAPDVGANAKGLIPDVLEVDCESVVDLINCTASGSGFDDVISYLCVVVSLMHHWDIARCVPLLDWLSICSWLQTPKKKIANGLVAKAQVVVVDAFWDDNFPDWVSSFAQLASQMVLAPLSSGAVAWFLVLFSFACLGFALVCWYLPKKRKEKCTQIKHTYKVSVYKKSITKMRLTN